MNLYVSKREAKKIPRLPLKGAIDLTYRCNNNCRHCWLRLSDNSELKAEELSFDEIKSIVDQARSMGCHSWTISGGEPLLRPDFADIFGYISRHSMSYTLVTNGTLVTPEIARLLKKTGTKLVSLYGATAEVHDYITRRQGSFEELKRGISYLKEAGAGFTVQIVPLKSNYHQYQAMLDLASSWSADWRLGAAWLYFAADGNKLKNKEISEERLPAEEVIKIDPPACPGFENLIDQESACQKPGEDFLYSKCISERREFHVDPYGRASFCCFVMDPELRVDLRKICFSEFWDKLLPAMARKIKTGKNYVDSCFSCDLRPYCRSCPVYAYLEHRDHSARVEYLCDLAREAKAWRDEWCRTHRRYYRIADITIQVDSDLPFSASTFKSKFELFRVEKADKNPVEVYHHFSLPEVEKRELGQEVYRQPPWAIYRHGQAWIYTGIYPDPKQKEYFRMIVTNDEHTRAHVYHPSAELFHHGGHDSLMLLPSDQIFLARTLPRRGGVIVHGASFILKGQGLLFLGPSEAGKSTMVSLLRERGKILCDDRSVIVNRESGFYIYGSWSHGDIPDVSPDGGRLKALFFLRQARENRLEKLTDVKLILSELLARFVRPLATADWWEDVLSLAEKIVVNVPAYNLYFDKSGRIVDVLEDLTC